MSRRLTRVLLLALAVAALATAGIVANFVLLGYADSRNDPVGKLNPRATLTEPTPANSTSTPTTTADDGAEPELEEPDD
jgi:hypothetical protein